jgi:hypothetical protein
LKIKQTKGGKTPPFSISERSAAFGCRTLVHFKGAGFGYAPAISPRRDRDVQLLFPKQKCGPAKMPSRILFKSIPHCFLASLPQFLRT